MTVNLVFIKKDGTTQSFQLPSAVTFIGRRQDCDMCIPLSVVSRRHCQVYTEQGKIMVRDLKSRNGTFINGDSVDETQINAGDVLKIGPVKFVVQVDGVPEDLNKFLPSPEEQSQPQPTTASQDETQEADFEQVIEGIPNGNAGQSQTMDIDGIFTNDFLGDENFDLDSDLP